MPRKAQKKKGDNDDKVLEEALALKKEELKKMEEKAQILQTQSSEKRKLEAVKEHTLPKTKGNWNEAYVEHLQACGYKTERYETKSEKLDKSVALHLVCLFEMQLIQAARDGLSKEDLSILTINFFYRSFDVHCDKLLEELRNFCFATEEECAHFMSAPQRLQETHKPRSVTVSHLICLPLYNEMLYWERQRLLRWGYSAETEPLASALDNSSLAVYLPIEEVVCAFVNHLCIIDYEIGNGGKAWLALDQHDCMHSSDTLLSYDYMVKLPLSFGKTVKEFTEMQGHDKEFLQNYKEHCQKRTVSQRSRAILPLSFAFTELRLRPRFPSLPMVANSNSMFTLQHLPEHSNMRRWRDERLQAVSNLAVSDSYIALARFAGIAKSEESLTLQHSAQAYVDEMMMIIAAEYRQTRNVFSITELRTFQHAALIARSANSSLARLAEKAHPRGYEMTLYGAEWLLNAAFIAFHNGGYGADISPIFLGVDEKLVKNGIDAGYVYMNYLSHLYVHWFERVLLSFTELLAYSISASLDLSEDTAADKVKQLALMILIDSTEESEHHKKALEFLEDWKNPFVFISLLEVYEWYSREVDDTMRIRLVNIDHDEERVKLECWRLERSATFLKHYNDPNRQCNLHSAPLLDGVTPYAHRISVGACTLCSRKKHNENKNKK